MVHVIYIDVLFTLNLIINYFILLAVSRLLHRSDKRWRLFLGALLGAVYSLLIFFPELGFLYVSAAKFIFSLTMVLVAFKSGSIKSFVKLTICFYIISALFGGIIFALWMFATPPGMFMRNGIMYLNISPLLLIAASAACYILISLFSRFLHRHIDSDTIYDIEITVGGRTEKMHALLDTGNNLCDQLTGFPVIVAEYRQVESLLPKPLRDSFKKGVIGHKEVYSSDGWSERIRLIPYGSLGNVGGLLPAFRPDKVTIKSKDKNIETHAVIIAVCPKRLNDEGRYSALLNKHIFKEITV